VNYWQAKFYLDFNILISARVTMFSYVFMKILEGRPRSYDRIMDKASHGRVFLAKQSVAAQITEGAWVLEIGCGTGELASMCISRGATVEGFDANHAMVEAA
jgi:2-polyprenyl-3-methyl-5-hydroxy-6-metoxy-1,4-benzoquinol methylase